MRKHQGFSLVELMVAMVIGLVIILGAGQLFLTVFQTNRQVEALGEKQAAVNFAVESLMRDVRRAYWSDAEWSEDGLTLDLPNRGDLSGCDDVTKRYYLVEGQDNYLLAVRQSCRGKDLGSPEEIVGGFVDGGFDVEPLPDAAGDLNDGYGAVVTLKLRRAQGEGVDTIDFFVINRTAAVNSEPTVEE